MLIRSQRGFSQIDIVISVILITIFIALIGNLIVNINLNAKNVERKAMATSYAVQEIEKIKARKYVQDYDDKGIDREDIIEEKDIVNSTGEFLGYHKKVSIKDYVFIQGDNTKQKNLVKEIIVEISYKVGNQDKNVKILTYIAKE